MSNSSFMTQPSLETAAQKLKDYSAFKRRQHFPSLSEKYDIIGFISAGTYGRVYKARKFNPPLGYSLYY